jgi:hypothetical protein
MTQESEPRPSFPKLHSGRAAVTLTGAPLEISQFPRRWGITLTDLDQTEANVLMGFFCTCGGQFRAFDFPYKAKAYVCRFESDKLPLLEAGHGHDVSFSILETT